MMVLMPSEASSWLAADPIAGGDLEPYRQRRNEPKKRGAIASAEMTFLLVLLSCVVKGVGLGRHPPVGSRRSWRTGVRQFGALFLKKVHVFNSLSVS
jgi:hypothetical protein